MRNGISKVSSLHPQGLMAILMNLRSAWTRGVLSAAAIALLLAPSLGYARLFGPNLFVAGDGFTLEQAVSDAAKQHTSQDVPAYKLLVVGSEIQRIKTSAESSDVRDLLQQAAQHGASIFVCVKDLKALGLKPADLVPDVRPVRGLSSSADGNRSTWEKSLPQAPDQKMRSICSRN